MKILINCSNLKAGGGIQVADSICRNLNQFPHLDFLVVLSKHLCYLTTEIGAFPNVKVIKYNSNNGIKVLMTGRDEILDNLVSQHHINIVFSVFGPITWTPRCPHFCGFARPHLVLENSPYYARMGFLQRQISYLQNRILTFFFCRGVSAFFTENQYITDKWKKKSKKPVYTVTNYYNQVYDNPNEWKECRIPPYDGLTLLCITAKYPHKNLEIAIDILNTLKARKSTLNIRFVFTINEHEYPALPEQLRSHFLFLGKKAVNECPSLYRQADIMFQPTLLECFTATYPEAMKMEVPILTTDLEFARGLCGDAALYYSPLSAEDAACKIEQLATDASLRARLVAAGKEQLRRYDNYQQRVEKLIYLLENL